MSRSLIATAFRVRRAYLEKHGRAPRLLRPRRFTEKIQWRKLFDFNPLFPTLCDKIAVRDYIAGMEAGKGGSHSGCDHAYGICSG